jgi:hypothetical protein
MGDMKQAARSAMAAQLISALVADHGRAFKADLLAQMVDGGSERQRVRDDDGTDLGTVSTSAGRKAAKVTDVRAFTDWVAQRYPTELVQVVAEAFVRKLLDAALAAEAPVDVRTGEVIPGVEVVTGEPFLTVRPTTDAKTRMRETLRTSGLLALPSGGDQ